MSAVYTLRRKVEHWKIVQKLQGSYKPKIFHGIGFIREGIHYTPPSIPKTTYRIEYEKKLPSKKDYVDARECTMAGLQYRKAGFSNNLINMSLKRR